MQITCKIHFDSAGSGVSSQVFRYSGIGILEAARRAAVQHCRDFRCEGVFNVELEYEHDGAVITDSVKVQVKMVPTVINPRNGEED